ncbi:HtaA domain-containing protein [Rhodococcoides fascians]|uniref:HtaA domain-containing protein n=1 Tax=Rhodococcoides fascians TaxID=1828 RepID=UPI0005601A0C|nr:HtaA domain-containing protein [Rhodococcus fascians]
MTLRTGLLWGFKASFREYIQLVSGHVVIVSPASEVDSKYFFPFSGKHEDGDHGATLLRFDGSVSFTGHGGLLSMTIATPTVVFHEGRATLSIRDPKDAMRLMPLADLAMPSTAGPVPASLTPQGSATLQGTYSTGAALDDVVLRLG